MGIVVDFVQSTLWQSESGSFRIAVWGACCIAAAIVGYFFLAFLLARHKSNSSAFDIVTITFFGGMVGSKIHSMIETGQILFPNGFSSAFISSGMNYQGGLILAIFAGCFHVYVSGESVSKTIDLAAIANLISHGIGKLGCFFSGDGCYGIPTELPWGMSFPNGRVPTTQFVHPVPLYELILSWAAAWILYQRSREWINNPASYRPWDNATLGLALMGIFRFFIETVRGHPIVFLGLTSFQLVGASLFAIAMFARLLLSEYMWNNKSRKQKTN